MNKISAVYKIVNTVTGEFYVGSSVNVKNRWAKHKCLSTWNRYPNIPLYQDMQKYGLDCFSFEILEEVETQYLKQEEQRFIDTLKPAYNNYNAKGLNVERIKATNRESKKKYAHSEKGKAAHRKYDRKRDNQLCIYNGETLTFNALRIRFRRAGISHPTSEAKKYLKV